MLTQQERQYIDEMNNLYSKRFDGIAYAMSKACSFKNGECVRYRHIGIRGMRLAKSCCEDDKPCTHHTEQGCNLDKNQINAKNKK